MSPLVSCLLLIGWKLSLLLLVRDLYKRLASALHVLPLNIAYEFSWMHVRRARTSGERGSALHKLMKKLRTQKNLGVDDTER